MRKALVAMAVSVVMLGWGSSRAMAVCGDGVVDPPDEQCDRGGTCIGGSTAGMACHVGGTTCTGGTCTTFGGSGCAANCTNEHDVPFTLVPGQLDGLSVAPGTSGVAIDSDFLSIPLPFGGACVGGENSTQSCTSNADCPGGTCVQSQQALTVGEERNGIIPVVVKAASVKFPGIPVSTLACGCIHGISSKTCGGTFFEADGKTLSPNCTPGFSDCKTASCSTSGEPCAGKAPCAFVHGEGNTAAGEIGCNGLDGVNITFEQDSGGSSGVCAAPKTCPAIVTFSGHGGPGSSVIFQTLGITAALGPCTGTDASYGPDGVFCTADDPAGGIISVAGTLPVTTGTATAVVRNANGSDGSDLGPVMTTGAAFNCTALECGDKSSAAGAGVVGAFSFVHLDTVGDVAVTAQLFGAGTLPDPNQCTTGPPLCVGDCDKSGEVTVDELILLVNIDLGSAPVSACVNGLPPGTDVVDITLIIQAVNIALTACPVA